MIDEWIDRIKNSMEIQKEFGYDIMTIRCTRRELTELLMIMNAVKELEEQKNDSRMR